jgi:pimeloyl-ACP methyl ester carboxylesterase
MIRRPARRVGCALALLLAAACRAGAPTPETATAAEWIDPAPHASHLVEINGNRMHYLDWGGAGPPLILVHGFADNPHAFDDLAPAFTDRHRVVAYARRGHGRSGAAPPFDAATLLGDLRGLMDHLGIDRASLAGWSMGGNEITAMAAAHPERVDRLVYLDAAYDWADPAMVNAFEVFPTDVTPPASAMTSLEAYMGNYLATWFPGLPDRRPVEAWVRDMVTINPDGTVTSVMSDATAEGLTATLFSDRRDYRAVRAPALAIYSETFLDLSHAPAAQLEKNRVWERDLFVPFRQASVARIREELPGVEILHVPGTHGDFVFVSRDRVVEAMHPFLAGG